MPLPVPASRQSTTSPWLGREVILGIRPEHLVLANGSAPGTGADAANSATIQVSVRLVEHLGSELLAHFKVADQALVARLPADAALKVGENRNVAVNVALSHLFDPTSEQRITEGTVP